MFSVEDILQSWALDGLVNLGGLKRVHTGH